jgi:hypothetical protein
MTRVMEKLGMPIPAFKLDRWAEIELKDNKLSVRGIDKLGGPFTLFKSIKAIYDKNAQNQKIELKFQGHYNENSLTLFVPTKTLQEEGKVRVNMKCNPYGCSNDGRRVTFGHWETSKVFLYEKDGSKINEASAFELKQEQGPLVPTPESLLNTKAATGNAGSATPASFNIKNNKSKLLNKNSSNSLASASTASSKGARRNSAARNSPNVSKNNLKPQQ